MLTKYELTKIKLELESDIKAITKEIKQKDIKNINVKKVNKKWHKYVDAENKVIYVEKTEILELKKELKKQNILVKAVEEDLKQLEIHYVQKYLGGK